MHLLTLHALLFVFTVSALGTTLAREPDPARQLADARGRQRLLLVFAPDATTARKQADLWKPAAAAFAERDIHIIADARPLAARYGIEPGEFCVILIGKDGHDAARYPSPVEPAEIERTIDAMPMRQAEMKRNRAPR